MFIPQKLPGKVLLRLLLYLRDQPNIEAVNKFLDESAVDKRLYSLGLCRCFRHQLHPRNQCCVFLSTPISLHTMLSSSSQH